MPDVKSKKQEKLTEMKDYCDLAEKLVQQKQAELGDIDHRILLKKNELKRLQESMVSATGFYNQNMQDKSMRFDSETTAKKNELIAREYKISENEKQIAKRLEEVAARENRVLVLEKERTDISNARIDVERLFSQANVKLNEALRIKEDGEKLLSISKITEKETKEMLNKNSSILSSLNSERDKLETLNKDIKLREKNIAEAKEVLAPKIEEMKLSEERQKVRERELQEKENSVKAKLEEDLQIIRSLEKREETCKAKELELTQKEEEILRKSLLLTK